MKPRILGVGSWISDASTESVSLRYGTYGARYLDGWVVKANR